MTIAPGTRLGPYQILALLGAGGMGEVYRARDTRLGRDVAIKVLAPRLAATPEVRARFEREARTISQFNHPHICALYDIGGAGDTQYLVMELLEGETLAHRLDREPLPISEVLTLGAQIADALDRAHRAGVVHRDLKPGNVMLTSSGAKLMDFGLARAGAGGGGPVESAATRAQSPTVSRPLTAEGTIVGTFQYMAPEQLEGKEADARSDIWALGCVLYEMATGRRAFAGTSQASLISAIMKDEPRAIVELRPMTPPALDHAVRRCLAKDPAERWQSARDVMHELEWAGTGGPAGQTGPAGLPAAATAPPRHRRAVWIPVAAVAAVALVVLGALIGPRSEHRPARSALVRFSVTPTGNGAIVPDATACAISPDGQRLVYTMTDSTGTPRLWIRPLSGLTSRPLPGTEQPLLPFWSPDSRFIAFFAGGKLKKVSVDGGAPQTICGAPNGRGGTWNRDGVILFAPTISGPLCRVSADGGEATVVARPDSARGETGLRFPYFLPDGRHFLYTSLPRKSGNLEIYVGALDSSPPRRLMSASWSPVYADPGYLLFVSGDRLVAQPFDAGTLRLSGTPVQLDDVAPPTQLEGASVLTASDNGILAYAGTVPTNTQLAWIDRSGRSVGSVPLPAGSYVTPCLSPDGRYATLCKYNSSLDSDLWLADLRTSLTTRLTFSGQASTGGTGAGVAWSPDGNRIAFMYGIEGRYDVFEARVGERGEPEPLVQGGSAFKAPVAWSPDGRYLVYASAEITGWDLWLLPTEGDREPVPLLCSPFDEKAAAISPDGKWLAYSSNETGKDEIYVTSFPVPGKKHRVSSSGGSATQWSSNGKELIFWSVGTVVPTIGPVCAIDVETDPTFRAGVPHTLFTPAGNTLGLSATADLQRFLAAVPAGGAAPYGITVVMNWAAGLKK
jgi:Tol biopolymer transport system component